MQTSSQAVFMLHCMAKNPEAQEKLYKEIHSVVGDRTQLTPEDLTKMPYLKGCMLESIRYTIMYTAKSIINIKCMLPTMDDDKRPPTDSPCN